MSLAIETLTPEEVAVIKAALGIDGVAIADVAGLQGALDGKATSAQGDKADSAVQPDALGTAAAQNVDAFATAAQGSKADSAVQPAALSAEAMARIAADAAEAAARDEAIANYVAPVIDEVSQRLRIDAMAETADMGGELPSNALYVTPQTLKDFMVRPDRPMDARVIMIRPLINDLLNKAGGGHAIYAPIEYIFVHAPILGLNQGYMPANAASTEFPGYVKITLESAAPTIASTLYFAVVPSRYEIAIHAVQPAATGGYIPLISVWGEVVSAYPGVTIVTYDDGLLDPLSPIIGPDLFLTDQARPVYLDNLFADRKAIAPMVSLSSDAGFAGMQAGGRITLDPARIETSLSLRAIRQVESLDMRTRALTVHKRTDPLTGTGKILFLGDSIPNHLTLSLVDQGLTVRGGSPIWIGTVNSSNDPDWPDWDGGPLGECRPGWSTRDFLGTDLSDGDAPLGVLPAGQEPLYVAGTKASKLAYNPYLKALPSPSAAPTVVIGGTSYKFDLGNFRTRFALAVPDIVALNVAMNDLFEDASVFAANIGYIIAEIRRAFPLVKIILWATTLPFGEEAFARYTTSWAAILRTMVETVTQLRSAGDDKIYLCSAWAHQDPVAGWKLAALGSDAAGITDARLADFIHPYGVARQQHADALVDAIANLWPGNPEPPEGRRYWGVSSNGILSAADLIALAGHDDATVRAKAFSVDGGSGAGQYVYYAYPAAFGLPAGYRLFGFEENYVSLTVTFATVYGDRAYTVLRSLNKLTGVVPVEVA